MKCFLFYLISVGSLNVVPIAAQDTIDFSRDIRPILADHCFTCHGPDAATREGGFRLDDLASALGEADSGEHPIVAGDLSASELVRRIRSADEGELMPPPETKKPLTATQIKLLERWIADGAEWQGHWAFQQPQRPPLPNVKNQSWARNPIDQFVMAKLEARGSGPSPTATKTTLIRRLYLDLTGLPPTPAEIDTFLTDDHPQAYEKLVDRLLASPRYGEHMATFWLDAARFADTNGYQNDFRRSMWLWRNWVIDAYNDNMPYDQFTIEQLAGDMLPDATLKQKIATGFNRNHRSNTEGGSINEEWLVENVVDRVETTSTVFLGLTMGCARCHDHKYDPISQREFYQFFSYFYNVDEQGVYTERRGNAGPLVSVPTKEFADQLTEAETLVADAQRKLTQKKQTAAQSQKNRQQNLHQETDAALALPNEVLTFLVPDEDARPAFVKSTENNLRDAEVLSTTAIGRAVSLTKENKRPVVLGAAFDFDATKNFTVSAWVKPTQFGAIVSRMDEAMAYRGFDMLLMPNGRMNVHLIHDWPSNGTKITTRMPLPKDQWTHVVVAVRTPGKAADIQVYMNGQKVPVAVNLDSLDGTTITDHPLWLGHRAQTTPFAGLISDFRIWDTDLSAEDAKRLFQATLTRQIKATEPQLSESQRSEIEDLFLYSQTVNELAQLRQAESKRNSIKKQMPTTMVMKELAEPRQAFVLLRGQYDQPDSQQPVSAGVPSLFRTESSPHNRLELAQWLVDGNNPLTARVAVNHFWSRIFGVGFVDTPENFGVQSSPPSHPQLLDWLATEFVRNGWDIKALQRLIVTSATYRQQSSASTEAFTRDPKNRWLSRGPRFRLPAESLRDNALAVSGLLVDRIGGPSIKPYQPTGLWADLAGGAGEPAYQQAQGEDLYRRSLYIYRKRTVPHPTMTTFDGGGRDLCAVSRDRTNTPLQALALLNDPTYVEAARALAIDIMQDHTDHEDRLKSAFRKATCRWPTPPELQVLRTAYQKYAARFSAAPETAKAYVQVGQFAPDTTLSNIELAAYASVCSVILNLDEVITKE
ncbi:MAG: DUF1553 domain-containing protein [Pirellulaceae bacterium]|nr:DUF1553 domain-containing protein [Pirellulaceae bacterium]